MSCKVTNLEEIKKIAKIFLYVDISETQLEFIASHPFTNSWIAMVSMKDGALDLHDEKDLVKWHEFMEKRIHEAELVDIFMMLNKPYILNFLKFTHKYMSDEDLGKILGSFWTLIEQISLDESITGKELVGWFTRADKKTLMDEEELECFNNLPDEVVIYRGVTSYNKKNKKAFSWTTDRKIAEWFANRFRTGTGEVWSLNVPRERILCSFEGRNEHEVIVNLYGFDGKIKVEKLAHREDV